MALNRTKKDGADAKSSLQHIRLQGNIAPHVKQINDGLYKETAVYHYPHKTGLFFIQIDRVAIRTNILHIFGYLAKLRPNFSQRQPPLEALIQHWKQLRILFPPCDNKFWISNNGADQCCRKMTKELVFLQKITYYLKSTSTLLSQAWSAYIFQNYIFQILHLYEAIDKRQVGRYPYLKRLNSPHICRFKIQNLQSNRNLSY